MALTYVNFALLTIAHLVGLVVAVILLIRVKGTPAILATVAFGLLFLLDIGQIMRTAFLNSLFLRRTNAPWAMGGFNCCCGLFDLIAIACLIVAIWQAVSGTGAQETTEEVEEISEGEIEESE